MPDFVSEPFSDGHDTSEFDSGEPDLDDWLRKSARSSDGRQITRTHVWHANDGVVLAYYSLMPYTIQRDELTNEQARGLPNLIPCYLIAKLALHLDLHGRRLGSVLLAEALEVAAGSSRQVGGRFVVVDAMSDQAASFYSHHGFDAVSGASDRYVMRVKDVLAHLDR